MWNLAEKKPDLHTHTHTYTHTHTRTHTHTDIPDADLPFLLIPPAAPVLPTGRLAGWRMKPPKSRLRQKIGGTPTKMQRGPRGAIGGRLFEAAECDAVRICRVSRPQALGRLCLGLPGLRGFTELSVCMYMDCHLSPSWLHAPGKGGKRKSSSGSGSFPPFLGGAFLCHRHHPSSSP